MKNEERKMLTKTRLLAQAAEADKHAEGPCLTLQSCKLAWFKTTRWQVAGGAHGAGQRGCISNTKT
jgi:hypothetical protein